MFFYLSKILSFLTTPVAWIFLILLMAIITRDKKKKKNRLITAFLFFLFFSNLFVARTVMRLWEPRPIPISSLYKQYDVGVVLAGGMAFLGEENQAVFKNNPDRIIQTIILYNKGVIKKILLSGGDATILHDNSQNEATLLKQFLLQLGIPEKDILVDSLSRNTYENAANSSRIIKNSFPSDVQVLLITSASHMYRSFACFYKQDIIPDIFPVDHHALSKDYDLVSIILPNSKAFQIWDELFHEWFGLAIYYIIGYI
ncbi:MAG: YdcF family protein [Bacteroidales bacterium]|nr:YdcF family protein [Bacteroidales bacterium]